MPPLAAHDEPAGRASIAIVGLGPRGGSLIERLGVHLAALPAAPPIELHLIDDAQPGAGRIWRTDQTRELCMNTLADAVTLFTEPGSTVAGAVVPGPTLYEWCILAREQALGHGAPETAATAEIPSSRAATFAAYPARTGLAADYREELARLRPESHPSRALYGEYLSWFFERALAELPGSVAVVRHRARAIAVEHADGRERITLDRAKPATGNSVADQSITVDSVIAATGWLPRAASSSDAALADRVADRPELTWVRQGSPVEQDLSGVRPGEHVIVRGLGMGFFDTVTLLTLGRGGRYEPAPEAPGGLRYVASGNEPVLHVTSRRGVPFRAKSRYNALPPQAEQRLLREVDWRQVPRPMNFDAVLWPRIVGDAFLAHAETLARVKPGALLAGGGAAPGDPDPADALAGIEAAIRAAIARAGNHTDVPALGDIVDAIAAAVAPFIPASEDRLDLAGEIVPVHETFESPDAFDAWVARRVADDLREVDLGTDSAVKAGLWSVSSARGFAAQVGTLGGFDAESRSNGLALLTALGGMVGSGPPAFRNNELLALAAAGIVHFIGPEATLSVDERGFVASSRAVSGSEVTARALVDAWMQFHDARASEDPFTASLLDAGRARVFSIGSRSGATAATGGLDIDAATGRLIGADGTLDAAVHVAGIPVDDTLHGTVISPMPGTDPPMLRETDRVSASALAVALRAAAPRIHEGALSA
ncbi:FAD/NAD(P)-binding protein [Leucobacter aridicollis]|uniref:FAD/NAD(P)-binding protein n=1 Tax=Leucobacter aridicollis TaxID=283878 RepID=UPI002168183F|nr:FAD/NAD(P)-binding protein [Leucobacter aridicollis]MCS3428769.1 putative NAD(P)/FAD-binding protein YdhS [Leucobacter aridicollis]